MDFIYVTRFVLYLTISQNQPRNERNILYSSEVPPRLGLWFNWSSIQLSHCYVFVVIFLSVRALKCF